MSLCPPARCGCSFDTSTLEIARAADGRVSIDLPGTDDDAGSYTPTLSGMAIGSGGTAVNSAQYLYVGTGFSGDRGLLHVHGQIAFGTSGATFPSSPSVSLPAGFVAVADDYSAGRTTIGRLMLVDDSAGPGLFYGVVEYIDTTSVRFARQAVSGSDTIRVGIIATTPFTWAAGDQLYWDASLIVDRV